MNVKSGRVRGGSKSAYWGAGIRKRGSNFDARIMNTRVYVCVCVCVCVCVRGGDGREIESAEQCWFSVCYSSD